MLPERRRSAAFALSSILLFSVLLLAEAMYCYARPKTGLDTLFYISLLQHGSQQAFRTAAATCDVELPVPFNGCDAMQEVRPEIAAYSAQDYATMLRFYTVKPLYIWVGTGVERLTGGDGFRALRMVSAGSFVAIGLLLAVWLRRHLSPAAACGVALLIASTPQVQDLGKWLLPDALALAVMLVVIYLVLYVVRGRWLQVGLLAVLPLVRPENVLFCVAWAALLLWRGAATVRNRWVQLGGLGVGCLVYEAVLAYTTRPLSYRVLFYRSFLGWTAPAAYPLLHVSVHDYVRVMAVYGTLSVVRYFAFTLLFATLALANPGLWRPLRDLLVAALLATFGRLLLSPGPEQRYYVWHMVLAAVAATVGFVELLPTGSWIRGRTDAADGARSARVAD